MRKLSDFTDDINKCSKCGKCQEVCPIYKLTGNDCAVSRGKFLMLQGVLKGDLKLSKTIEKYLDLCLKCGKCEDFCPSGIHVCQIFNAAKYEYVKNKFYGKITRFLQSPKVFNKMLNIFQKNNRLTETKTLKPAHDDEHHTKLLYFKGCANIINPKSERAMKKVLSNFDVELIEKNFDCCGVPFLSSGNLKRYEEAKKHNLELLKGDYDYIVTDCASCESALKDYATPDCYKETDELYIVNICHFLAIQDKKFIFKKPLKVTFHKPCHLKSDAFIRPLIGRCINVEYIEAEKHDECCGFAGEFALRNPKLSLKMMREKAQNLAATGADIILTSCPACIIGIQQGFLGKKHPKIMNIIEFLALADEII